MCLVAVWFVLWHYVLCSVFCSKNVTVECTLCSLLTKKCISDGSHILSLNSSLGVIVLVLNGVNAETWADMVVKKKKKYQGQPWDLCMFCLVNAVLVKTYSGTERWKLITSDNSLPEFKCLWLNVFTLHFHIERFSQ